MYPSLVTAGVLGSALLAGAACAAGEKAGRFTMSPAEGGGFVRLDSETGQMSLCRRYDADWSCREMGDAGRGLGEEVERLRAENLRLRSEIRQMEEIMLGDKRADRAPGADRKGPELKLPTEQDIDTALSYVQRMLRKFRDKLKELEADGRGTQL